MPRKAFLKKKSLLDRFKDDYATHTGYIQSARAKHTWNNPLTRRKRTKELNKWINSFAGKDHIHKLARFNATNAGRYESMYDEAMSLKGFLENLTEKLTKQFDLDLEEVQAYLNSHTQEMQELLDDTELSLKEKVLFVRSEITGEKDEAVKPSEAIQINTPIVLYKGDAENAEKAFKYLCDKIPHVKSAYFYCNVKPTDGNNYCGVGIRGPRTYAQSMFYNYANLYNDDFWNNCDADPQGWVNPQTIARYDVATPRQESNETDEKLGYEKGHKNSRGEDAPWVIRSHEDNRVLASFAKKKDAEEHLKRMKQYSKTESKANEEAEIKDKQYYLDMFDKAYKECVQLDIDDGGDGQNWADYFATGDDDPATFSQKEADEIVGYYMEFHPNGEGETDRPYKDWMENIDNSPKTALDKEITRILKALYAPDESKQSESDEDFWDAIRKNPVAQELLDEYDRVVNQVIAEVDKTDPDGPWQDEFDAEVYSTENAKAWAGHFLSLYGKDALKEWKYCWEPYNEPVFKEGDKLLTSALKDVPESKQTEASDLAGYTSDVISELDVVWACGENGAKRLADKYADVIQQNYTDGDLLAAETAKFIAGQEHLDESRKKKQESKQSEVHLELFDTIIVPKWLWDAHNFGNEYGEDLDEHEQEILSKFESEYGKQYYLDDRSEEADFRSRNDFDEYGGPCYEVDVYKMS